MKPEDILDLARKTYASGVKPVFGTWGIGREYACVLGAACMATGMTAKSADEAAYLLDLSWLFTEGVLVGFDNRKIIDSDPDFQAGYEFGQQARREFITHENPQS